MDLLDPFKALEFLLDLDGDRGLDILGSDALVACRDKEALQFEGLVSASTV